MLLSPHALSLHLHSSSNHTMMMDNLSVCVCARARMFALSEISVTATNHPSDQNILINIRNVCHRLTEPQQLIHVCRLTSVQLYILNSRGEEE